MLFPMCCIARLALFSACICGQWLPIKSNRRAQTVHFSETLLALFGVGTWEGYDISVENVQNTKVQSGKIQISSLPCSQ